MTQISRVSMGLAVRAAREAAKLTLSALSQKTDIPVSTLSRTETGGRSIEFVEALTICKAINIDIATLRDLAETFERDGAYEKDRSKKQIEFDLNNLQRVAVETAIAALNK